jgi:hypothetical protein
MNDSPKESELEREIREFADCKSCIYLTRTPRKSRYGNQIIWSGLVDEFQLNFEGRRKKFCYQWERRGDWREGVKDIAREIVTEQSFESALSKDMQCKPELYTYFRMEKEMAVNQLNGKTVEFGFNSAIAGSVGGNGTFSVTKHSDRTVTICIVVKNAVGGLHPKGAQFYLSQKQVDSIKQNPTGSITEFSCFVR